MPLVTHYLLNDLANFGDDSELGYNAKKVGSGTPSVTKVGQYNPTLKFNGSYCLDMGARCHNVLQTYNTASRSISMWIYPTTVSGYRTLFATNTTTQSHKKYWSIRDGTLFFQDNQAGARTGSYVKANQWNHVGISVDTSQNVRQYVNGVMRNLTKNGSLSNWSSSPVRYIGARESIKIPYSGNMADIRIYEGLLTHQQYLNVYNAGPTIPSVPFLEELETGTSGVSLKVNGESGVTYEISNGSKTITALSGQIIPFTGLTSNSNINMKLYEVPSLRKVRKVIVRGNVFNKEAISLGEVQVFSRSGGNVARSGSASQNSTAHNGYASYAINGTTHGRWPTTHTNGNSTGTWWRVTLTRDYTDIYKIIVYNRTDCCQSRLNNKSIDLLDSGNGVLLSYRLTGANTQTINIP